VRPEILRLLLDSEACLLVVAVDLPDRGHREHPRGHPAGPGRGARHREGTPTSSPSSGRPGSRCSTTSPARGRPGGVRRHLRHAGELPAHAGALDETSKELGRYVRLTNYASGLCMPEIATLAGLERLDMMLNDSMYGILFRDINPIRTFVDQRFSGRSTPAPASSSTPARTTTSPPPTPSRPRTPSPSASCSTSTSRRRPGSRTGSSASGTPSRSTPISPSFRLELAHALLARSCSPRRR
jgi:hypothetical protein